VVKANTGTKCRTFLGPGRHAYLAIPRKKINGCEMGRPPQTVKSILNVWNGVCILAGDGIDSPIIHTRQTGEAQDESEGSITPADSISAMRLSSAVPEAKGIDEVVAG